MYSSRHSRHKQTHNISIQGQVSLYRKVSLIGGGVQTLNIY